METVLLIFTGLLIGGVMGMLLANARSAKLVEKLNMRYSELDKCYAIAVADKQRMEQMITDERKEMQERQAAVRDDYSRQLAENKKMMEQQMNMMEERLKNVTTELLKLRSQELQQSNTTQMSAIISPLKETIGEMKKAMESTREQGTKNTASLEKAIENVLSRAAEIGNKADNLANALKNENKTQGNWGEMILTELLEGQGLKRGIHYSVQETLRDDMVMPL